MINSSWYAVQRKRVGGDWETSLSQRDESEANQEWLKMVGEIAKQIKQNDGTESRLVKYTVEIIDDDLTANKEEV